MLDAGLKTQLKGYLDRLTAPVEIAASLGESAAAREMQEHGTFAFAEQAISYRDLSAMFKA